MQVALLRQYSIYFFLNAPQPDLMYTHYSSSQTEMYKPAILNILSLGKWHANPFREKEINYSHLYSQLLFLVYVTCSFLLFFYLFLFLLLLLLLFSAVDFIVVFVAVVTGYNAECVYSFTFATLN